MLSLVLLGIWGCTDLGVSCSAGLGCDDVCGSDGGPGTSGYLDECGECGGPGYNAGGCCDEEGEDCLSYADILSIFDTSYSGSIKCTMCHSGSGGLTLTSYVNLMSGGTHGSVVIPLESENSNLILKLNSSPPFGSQMPDGGPPLGASIITLIATWIDQGAIESPTP